MKIHWRTALRRPAVQTAVCLIWLLLVFHLLNGKPQPPQPFPTQGRNLIPSRITYNAELAGSLDQSLRDYWQKPDQVLASLGDLDGLKVADIGCGEGYFTKRLVQAVGPGGLVYATDIQKELLDQLAAEIPPAQKDRVRFILIEGDDTGIPETVDLILLIQVLGELDNQKDYLDQLKQIMDQNTRLVIIDSKHITDPESGFTRPLNMANLRRELTESGFVFAGNYDQFAFLPKQFFFVLQKAPEPNHG